MGWSPPQPWFCICGLCDWLLYPYAMVSENGENGKGGGVKGKARSTVI